MVKPTKVWRLLPLQKELSGKLSRELGILPVVAQILINRGIHDVASAEQFLRGSIEGLADPWLMAGIDQAVDRIVKAIGCQEKVTVYGDYDVDGITATALMFRVLKRLGARVEYYIPERQGEGYGLNDMALDFLGCSGTTLLVTVDCGISALAEVAKMAGRMEIIITDHHQPPPELPAAYAVINPKLPNCLYPDKNLSGVGVAFKLCQALMQKMAVNSWQLEEYLDLVAVGTIADIVPLTGENRILVKAGLAQMAGTINAGLKALMAEARLTVDGINAAKVGFVIAPRLNAVGRLSHAAAGVELLVTHDETRAAELASDLNGENAKRQAVEKGVLAAAEELLATGDFFGQRVLVLAGEEWHPGVIGIVASRLVEKYYRPVVMINVKDGVGKGSCRSIPGFDIYRALECCGEYLIQFGGHQQAAGLSVEAANINMLREKLNQLAAKWLNAEDYQPVINIESQLALADINDSLLEQLACLAPYGMGNPSPVFSCTDLTVINVRPLGKDGRHFKLRVRQRDAAVNVLAWDMAGIAGTVDSRGIVDVAFVPEFNDWQGQRSIQLRARDLKARDILPAGLQICDCRGKVDKADYVFQLAKQARVIVYVTDRQAAVALAAKLRSSLPGKIAVYYDNGDERTRVRVLKAWRGGAVQVLICSGKADGVEERPNHVVLYDPPLSAGIFGGQCGKAGEWLPLTLHFIYGKEDVSKTASRLTDWFPDRISVGQVYLVLRDLGRLKAGLTVVNARISRHVNQRFGRNIGCEAVAQALRILADLGLVDEDSGKAPRVLWLKPEPQEKLAIDKSPAYRKCRTTREAFGRWSAMLLKSSVSELWRSASERDKEEQ